MGKCGVMMLFGGAQGSGKSTRAQHLGESDGWHVIQGDRLDCCVIGLDTLRRMPGRDRLNARVPVFQQAVVDAFAQGHSRIVFDTALFSGGEGVPATEYRRAVLAVVPGGIARVLVVFRPRDPERHYAGHCDKRMASHKPPISRPDFDRHVTTHYRGLDMDAIQGAEGWDVAMVIDPVSPESDCARILREIGDLDGAAPRDSSSLIPSAPGPDVQLPG